MGPLSKSMRILISGATGFVGNNLTKRLVGEKNEIIAIGSDNEQDIRKLDCYAITQPFYEFNVKNFLPIDVFFHEAAIADTRISDGKLMNFVNCESSIRLFEELIKNGCKKIVYASSTAVYGNSPPPYVEGENEFPLNVYGESKLNLDREAMNLAEKNPDVSIIGLRYCNVFGPGENHKGKMSSMIYQLAHQIRKGNPKIFKWGEQKRDFIYVKDVIDANLSAMNAKGSFVVNCGVGNPRSFNEIIKSLTDVLKVKREIEYIDNPYLDKFQNYTECDMSKAKKMLNFSPKFSLENALEDYYLSGGLLEAPIKGNYK